jgi:large subunit ribosomal protein L9
MKVILLKNVPKLGQKYDVKNVSDGYALNYLLPRGLVQKATEEALRKIEEDKSRDLAQRKIQEELLLKSLDDLKKVTLNFEEKTNEKGHLFAGLTKEAIANGLKRQANFTIEPENIILEKPIKESGEHSIKISVLGKEADFTVKVSSLS